MNNKAKATDRGNQRQVLVYHGKKLGGGIQTNPSGFYVTADRSMAERFFGDLYRVFVPACKLLADPEQEGFADKALSGLESLKLGSAIAPHKYYQLLNKA